MKKQILRILSMLCLLALGMSGFPALAAAETLTLATPRLAIAVEEWVDLSGLVLSGKVTGWTSSDATVLKVAADGSATGLKVGQATLTAKGANNQIATCTVTVGYYSGIDVSYAQTIDWEVFSRQGMSFAIFRSSYGWYDPVADAKEDYEFQLDEKFRANVAGAKQYGMPFGIYHYSYADSVADAEAEAEYLLTLLERCGVTPADLKLPIAYDVEHNTTKYPCLDNLLAMGKTKATEVMMAFFQKLQNAGYRTALYSSKSYLNDLFDLKALTQNGVRLWMAWFPKNGEYKDQDGKIYTVQDPPTLQGYKPYMWQYSETGKVAGVERLSTDPAQVDTVDLDVLYMSEMMLHRPNQKPDVPIIPPDPTLMGDVDGSGEVAPADALMALQASTGKVALTEAQTLAADVDRSKTVTPNDALMILQYATKKISSF